MKAQIIIPIGNGICDIRIHEIPDLSPLDSKKTN